MSGWMLISRIGSFNVMIPIATALGCGLAASGNWHTLRWWCGSILGLVCLTAASKIAFLGWGVGIRSLDFTGFSGHAALAAAVLPATFVSALHRRSRPLRWCGLLSGLIVAACVAVARVKLHAHSVAEVVGAMLIGAAASALVVRSLAAPQQLEMRRPLVVACLLALAAASMMRPAPTQRWMIASALYLSGQDRPFIRQGWRRAPQTWKRAPPLAVEFRANGEK
ncbi:phosphatase PAP2 family protein [Massilia sp. R2A-15]|uniref:phosphatase PAP2 family protein n=1 Tax=Massilia sp. R2A-15 TaxID=3064278 RepID=UPI0027352DD4|nr:phosphatase PAP2 family protein [Massilia sp. R2A-15]WLI91134.1 phosphatase PAP2 family protein [Massilia sp. R2A-15]